ncbi:twin-arginine translocation signal domain-containing protein [Nocardioides guangzhouensis]|uniref:twin-arginine translocation signal domain-containing protein n=1 Tax=Nocardioides guangzhouensis TaxID=2497878 RepID=UPI001FEBAF2C|nr:twin-arginine translocation signal domain-containing protein [Nocardioides guangzhouensis]
MHPSRRTVLRAGALTSAAALLPTAAVLRDVRPSAAAQPLPSNPFRLGVASGDPSRTVS